MGPKEGKRISIFKACRDGLLPRLTEDLAGGADVNVISKAGIPLLFAACQFGQKNVVKLLLNKGADVNQVTNEGATPLYVACQKGFKDIASLLLGGGADANQGKNDGSTPLYAACQNNFEEIVTLLLDASANVNQTRNSGATPLFISCQLGNKGVVDILLGNGADTEAARQDGTVALHIACQSGNADIAANLLNYGAKVDVTKEGGWTPLLFACQKGYRDVAALLLDNGAEVDRSLKDGVSASFIACQNGQADVVSLLLERGADPNKARKTGATPLYVACQNGFADVVALLLDKGANVEGSKKNGATPLYIACYQGHFDVVLLLKKNGANRNLPMKDGTTPLEIALQRGHMDVAVVLASTPEAQGEVEETIRSRTEAAKQASIISEPVQLCETGSQQDVCTGNQEEEEQSLSLSLAQNSEEEQGAQDDHLVQADDPNPGPADGLDGFPPELLTENDDPSLGEAAQDLSNELSQGLETKENEHIGDMDEDKRTENSEGTGDNDLADIAPNLIVKEEEEFGGSVPAGNEFASSKASQAGDDQEDVAHKMGPISEQSAKENGSNNGSEMDAVDEQNNAGAASSNELQYNKADDEVEDANNRINDNLLAESEVGSSDDIEEQQKDGEVADIGDKAVSEISQPGKDADDGEQGGAHDSGRGRSIAGEPSEAELQAENPAAADDGSSEEDKISQGFIPKMTEDADGVNQNDDAQENDEDLSEQHADEQTNEGAIVNNDKNMSLMKASSTINEGEDDNSEKAQKPALSDDEQSKDDEENDEGLSEEHADMQTNEGAIVNNGENMPSVKASSTINEGADNNSETAKKPALSDDEQPKDDPLAEPDDRPSSRNADMTPRSLSYKQSEHSDKEEAVVQPLEENEAAADDDFSERKSNITAGAPKEENSYAVDDGSGNPGDEGEERQGGDRLQNGEEDGINSSAKDPQSQDPVEDEMGQSSDDDDANPDSDHDDEMGRKSGYDTDPDDAIGRKSGYDTDADDAMDGNSGYDTEHEESRGSSMIAPTARQTTSHAEAGVDEEERTSAKPTNAKNDAGNAGVEDETNAGYRRQYTSDDDF